MNRINLQKRALGALTVVGLAATLVGPAYAAKPLPIEKAKRPVLSTLKSKAKRVTPVRSDATPTASNVKPIRVDGKPLPIIDPPVFLIPPAATSTKDPVPPRMPPGPVGPPVPAPSVTGTATPPIPTTSATPPVATPPIPNTN